MAYDFIPQSRKEITQAASYSVQNTKPLYDYLFEKFKRKGPIALSKKPTEKRQIKVSRGFKFNYHKRYCKSIRFKSCQTIFW